MTRKFDSWNPDVLRPSVYLLLLNSISFLLFFFFSFHLISLFLHSVPHVYFAFRCVLFCYVCWFYSVFTHPTGGFCSGLLNVCGKSSVSAITTFYYVMFELGGLQRPSHHLVAIGCKCLCIRPVNFARIRVVDHNGRADRNSRAKLVDVPQSRHVCAD